MVLASEFLGLLQYTVFIVLNFKETVPQLLTLKMSLLQLLLHFTILGLLLRKLVVTSAEHPRFHLRLIPLSRVLPSKCLKINLQLVNQFVLGLVLQLLDLFCELVNGLNQIVLIKRRTHLINHLLQRVVKLNFTWMILRCLKPCCLQMQM